MLVARQSADCCTMAALNEDATWSAGPIAHEESQRSLQLQLEQAMAALQTERARVEAEANKHAQAEARLSQLESELEKLRPRVSCTAPDSACAPHTSSTVWSDDPTPLRSSRSAAGLSQLKLQLNLSELRGEREKLQRAISQLQPSVEHVLSAFDRDPRDGMTPRDTPRSAELVQETPLSDWESTSSSALSSDRTVLATEPADTPLPRISLLSPSATGSRDPRSKDASASLEYDPRKEVIDFAALRREWEAKRNARLSASADTASPAAPRAPAPHTAAVSVPWLPLLRRGATWQATAPAPVTAEVEVPCIAQLEVTADASAGIHTRERPEGIQIRDAEGIHMRERPEGIHIRDAEVQVTADASAAEDLSQEDRPEGPITARERRIQALEKEISDAAAGAAAAERSSGRPSWAKLEPPSSWALPSTAIEPLLRTARDRGDEIAIELKGLGDKVCQDVCRAGDAVGQNVTKFGDAVGENVAKLGDAVGENVTKVGDSIGNRLLRVLACTPRDERGPCEVPVERMYLFHNGQARDGKRAVAGSKGLGWGDKLGEERAKLEVQIGRLVGMGQNLGLNVREMAAAVKSDVDGQFAPIASLAASEWDQITSEWDQKAKEAGMKLREMLSDGRQAGRSRKPTDRPPSDTAAESRLPEGGSSHSREGGESRRRRPKTRDGREGRAEGREGRDTREGRETRESREARALPA